VPRELGSNSARPCALTADTAALRPLRTSPAPFTAYRAQVKTWAPFNNTDVNLENASAWNYALVLDEVNCKPNPRCELRAGAR
jgi:hypothetical protein